MPAPFMTNTLTATITGTEVSTNNVPINRGLGNLAVNSNYSDFTTYQLLTTVGDNPITIPQGKAFQVYVKNNDSTLNIVVKYTPSGGASQSSPTLGPGDVFIIWQSAISPAPPAGAGITALSITATGNTLVEYFLGG